MDAELKAQLLAVGRDFPELEYPKEWTAALGEENLAKVASFMQEVDQRYGVQSGWDTNAQDASYFCSLQGAKRALRR